MANSFEFDTVKAEKDAALWRYNMERKLRIGLRFIGFLLALFLLLWSWFPTLVPDTIEVAGNFRRRFVSTFNKPLFTFVVVNIIIVAVYFLSNQKQTQKQTTNPDIYDEYVSSRRSTPASTASSDCPTTKEVVEDKQIVLVENAVAVSLVKQQPTTVDHTVTETKVSLPPPVKQQHTTIRQVTTKTKPNVSSSAMVKQSEYRRSRSMVSESRNQWPREFRRSETDIRKDLVISDRDPPRKSMEEMSSEEFQLSIDSFIAERKKTLMQENTAHYTRRKEKCMSIVVHN